MCATSKRFARALPARGICDSPMHSRSCNETGKAARIARRGKGARQKTNSLHSARIRKISPMLGKRDRPKQAARRSCKRRTYRDESQGGSAQSSAADRDPSLAQTARDSRRSKATSHAQSRDSEAQTRTIQEHAMSRARRKDSQKRRTPPGRERPAASGFAHGGGDARRSSRCATT